MRSIRRFAKKAIDGVEEAPVAGRYAPAYLFA